MLLLLLVVDSFHLEFRIGVASSDLLGRDGVESFHRLLSGFGGSSTLVVVVVVVVVLVLSPSCSSFFNDAHRLFSDRTGGATLFSLLYLCSIIDEYFRCERVCHMIRVHK